MDQASLTFQVSIKDLFMSHFQACQMSVKEHTFASQSLHTSTGSDYASEFS